MLNDYQNELHKMNIFVDLSLQPQDHGDDERDASSSTYENVSKFLQEDSDNINKLIPEVNLACSEREIFFDESDDDVSNFEPEQPQVANLSICGTNVENLTPAELQEIESASKSLLEDDDDEDDFDFSQVCFNLVFIATFIVFCRRVRTTLPR